MKTRLQPVFSILASLALIASLAAPASAAVPAPRDEPRPVILIPGMTASANWDCFLFELSCQDPDAWGWMPTADAYYANLMDAFSRAGYNQENGTFSVLFYDWRKPVADQVEWLKARIDELKAASGSAQVDLVGHSMGGLVARAYVQSDLYAGDVANVITLGSPHAGSAKSYPYWEAADFYQAEGFEELAMDFLLWYYMLREINPIPVYVLREVFPGILDVMSTSTYLYDEENGDQPKPEEDMIHRNLYLQDLNADLGTLFARTQVSTFSGQAVDTTERFYVHDRYFWDWPNWDDGEPEWDRAAEFISSAGDGTVLAASAELPPPANVREFRGVSHADLPNNRAVIRQIFYALGIPFPPHVLSGVKVPAAERQVLALALYGQATVSLDGPSGRQPYGLQVISQSGQPFTLLLLPAPKEGQYRVTVQATGSGEVALGLFDTAAPASPGMDVRQRWDVARMDLTTGSSQDFLFTHAKNMKASPSLQATPPLIELPAAPGGTRLSGRALAGQLVKVRNLDSGQLLGKARADAGGRFSISLQAALRAGQVIVPSAAGAIGNTITVTPDQTALPGLRR